MDWSILIREVSLVAASSWIALGVALGLSLLLFLGAPWSSSSVDEVVRLRKTRRLQGLGVGLASGVLYGSLFAFLIGADRNSSAIVFMVPPALATALAGQAVGVAIAGAMGAARVGRRVGHSRAVALRDYVSSPVLWAGRTLVLTSTIALILLSVLPLRRTPDGFPIANPWISALAVAPAVLVLILIEVGARILVSRASSAESANDLRRQDLRRVRIARTGAGAALGLGVLAFIFSVPQLIADIEPRTGSLAMANPSALIDYALLVEFAAVICVAISVAISFRANRSPSAKILRSNNLSEASR